MANKLAQALKAEYIIDDKEIEILCSVGVALFPDDGTTPDSLIYKADRAMYSTKQL